MGINVILVISSVILVIGIGGATIKFSETFEIEGMALAAIVGVLLNLLLPGKTEEKLTDETEVKAGIEGRGISSMNDLVSYETIK